MPGVHDIFMRRCLALAKLALGNVAPNPMVGAVLVHQGKIIGEGYHKKFGEAHAEVNCIANAEMYLAQASSRHRQQIIGESIMYVSLEPCTHFGKTPPCADLLIGKGITKVIIGSVDPFPGVNGKGIAKLMASDIHVESGILEEDCNALNKRFFCFQKNERPYIILKWAQTADGKIGKIDQPGIAISNQFTNRLVHKWRTEEAAIMVGTNTALSDNPKLTSRLWPGRNPIRILLDMDLRLPRTLNIFDSSSPTIILNSKQESKEGELQFVKITKGKFPEEILNKLYELQIQSVLVEGGAITLQSFIDAGLWDEARVITNTGLRLPGGIAAPVLKNAKVFDKKSIGNDLIQWSKIND